MPDYTALNRALQDTVELHTPDVLYPRKCIISNINENTIDVTTIIGGEAVINDLDYVGNPILGNEAILLPIENNFDSSIVICKDFTTVNENNVTIDENYLDNLVSDYKDNYKEEIKNQIVEILIERIDEDYFTPIIEEIRQELIEYDNLFESYKERVRLIQLELESTQVDISADKEEILERIRQKADKVHRHEFEDIYSNIDDL